MSGDGALGYSIDLVPEKITISYGLKFKIDNPNTNKRVTKFEGYDDSKLVCNRCYRCYRETSSY